MAELTFRALQELCWLWTTLDGYGDFKLEILTVIFLALGAYLLGSVPTAYIVFRLAKSDDIRRSGSRNEGALNAYQQVGARIGLTVLLVDTAKGVLAVVAPRWWAPTTGHCLSPLPWWLPVTTGRCSWASGAARARRPFLEFLWPSSHGSRS